MTTNIELSKLTQPQRLKLLNELIVAKFGSDRGAKASACQAVGIASSPYFYNMTNGRAPIPDSVLIALSALSGYSPVKLTIKNINPVTSAQYGDYVINLDKETADLLTWYLVRVGQRPPINTEHLSVIFPDALRAYIETFAEHKFALKDYDERVAKAAKSPAAAPEADAFD